ncbi:MAG: cupin domain-containing protein [Dehalococcoidia bacterium]|nr:cupin domain-containing protein [Dehalococcoidia bacterium]
MEVIKNGSVPEEDATNAPLFYGGPVSRQPIVGAQSDFFNFAQVNFYDGAKNKFHSHTTDQVLFVTGGEGIVATEDEEIVITEGDTAFIPSGEKHWHGAVDGKDFSHISLTGTGSETTQYDD